jgi:hypothetical protein
MAWFMVLQIVSTLVELIQIRRTSARCREVLGGILHDYYCDAA